ncbi:MAG: TIGR02186 family protein [Rhodovarius sp.]|nr:TIGR02186 family protein [Rhodovarius sp.]MCX7931405.1 TIGR02186 family protein [Rhodovarius sp.]MDW8315496.1 TIGR02186 family protein [Rhodovarius sp.]
MMRRRLPLLSLLLLALGWLWPGGAARAQDLVARLSVERVELSTTFAGASVLVFGASERFLGPGGAEVIVVTRGPVVPQVVRQKVRILGMWFNGPAARFPDVPAFYAVAGTLPAWRLLPEPLRERYGIGLDQLPLRSTGARGPAFRAALLRLKQQQGLWQEDIAPVAISGGRLFHLEMPLPSSIPEGLYRVEVLLVDEGRVIAQETLSFEVQQVGTAAAIAAVSRDQPLLYGVICVLLAILAGWLGSVIFRRS